LGRSCSSPLSRSPKCTSLLQALGARTVGTRLESDCQPRGSAGATVGSSVCVYRHQHRHCMVVTHTAPIFSNSCCMLGNFHLCSGMFVVTSEARICTKCRDWVSNTTALCLRGAMFTSVHQQQLYWQVIHGFLYFLQAVPKNKIKSQLLPYPPFQFKSFCHWCCSCHGLSH
jgi:hypothetical protein